MRILPDLAIVGSGQIRSSSAYDCHVYALRTNDGVVMIDSGSGLGEDEIVENLSADFPNVPIARILLTHAHTDHFGGAAALSRRLGCGVYAPTPSRSIIET